MKQPPLNTPDREVYAKLFKRKIVKNKYKNIPTEIDGLRFDSKKEAARYSELKLLMAAGEIMCFHRQVKYVLLLRVKGLFREKYYKADFVVTYRDRIEIEDIKSPMTRKLAYYQFKKHMMYEKFGILIKEK